MLSLVTIIICCYFAKCRTLFSVIWGRKVKEEGSRVMLVHAVLKLAVIVVLTRMCLLLVRRYLNVSMDIPKIR